MNDRIVNKMYVKSPRVMHPVIDFVLGIYHRYPLCCIASFALKTILNKHSSAERIYNPFGYLIPCRFHTEKRLRKCLNLGFDLDDL